MNARHFMLIVFIFFFYINSATSQIVGNAMLSVDSCYNSINIKAWEDHTLKQMQSVEANDSFRNYLYNQLTNRIFPMLEYMIKSDLIGNSTNNYICRYVILITYNTIFTDEIKIYFYYVNNHNNFMLKYGDLLNKNFSIEKEEPEGIKNIDSVFSYIKQYVSIRGDKGAEATVAPLILF